VAIKPIFEVTSIDDALARVNAYGVRVSGAMATYGQKNYQDCIDPEGNVIQLCQQS
jgi:predicted enzyme related to lactoylglutathione lyase